MKRTMYAFLRVRLYLGGEAYFFFLSHVQCLRGNRGRRRYTDVCAVLLASNSRRFSHTQL